MAGHYILQLWFLSFYLSSSFVVFIFFAYSQQSHTGCLPYFHIWCGLSVNVECRSEIYCTRLAEIQDAKNAKNSPSAHHRTILSNYISATKVFIGNRKKIAKQQYLLHMFSQYGELRPTSGWDRLASLGHTSKFQQVSRLGLVTAPTSLNEVNQTLHDVWPSMGWYTVYIFGGLAPNRILSGAKFTLRPSLAFSYIGNVTARHSRSGRQLNFAAFSMLPVNSSHGQLVTCDELTVWRVDWTILTRQLTYCLGCTTCDSSL